MSVPWLAALSTELNPGFSSLSQFKLGEMKQIQQLHSCAFRKKHEDNYSIIIITITATTTITAITTTF